MYVVITASPNKGGLTAAAGSMALEGIAAAGGEARLIDLCEMKLSACMVCGNGWGICREQHSCVIEDGLSELQDTLSQCEGVFMITPVYWGQPSERMKAFMDRLRRCEALKGDEGALAGKTINMAAAAGGSGNGTVTCLMEMENWSRHLRAIPKERMGINRFNKDEMLAAVWRAAMSMAER